MPDKQILLYVCRHGTTAMNEQNRFRGDSNPNLDAKGYKDANELAFYFEPIDLSFIVSSSKTRAATTANIISLQKKLKQSVEDKCRFDLTPVLNDLLHPWNVGDFGGKEKTPERIKELQGYISDPDKPVPGGTSLNDFRGRVRPLFKEAIEASNEAGVPGLLVVHSSVIHELGECLSGNHEAGHVRPGGVAAVYIHNGKLGVEPIFKPDDKSKTQNILGVGRSGLSS